MPNSTVTKYLQVRMKSESEATGVKQSAETDNMTVGPKTIGASSTILAGTRGHLGGVGEGIRSSSIFIDLINCDKAEEIMIHRQGLYYYRGGLEG